MPEVEIRTAIQSDVPQILSIYAPYITNTVTSFEIDIPTELDFWNRIIEVQKDSPWLVCCVGGEVAGYAYACPHRSREAYMRSRELSVYISDDYQHRGIGKTLYKSVIEILKIQGYTNVLAGIVFPNEKSISFHLEQGFEEVGIYKKVGYKFGAFHDVAWYQKFIGDQNEVLPLKSMHEVMSLDGTKNMLSTKAKEIKFL